MLREIMKTTRLSMAVNVLDFVETHHLLSFQESDFRESTEAANENHEGYYSAKKTKTGNSRD